MAWRDVVFEATLLASAVPPVAALIASKRAASRLTSAGWLALAGIASSGVLGLGVLLTRPEDATLVGALTAAAAVALVVVLRRAGQVDQSPVATDAEIGASSETPIAVVPEQGEWARSGVAHSEVPAGWLSRTLAITEDAAGTLFVLQRPPSRLWRPFGFIAALWTTITIITAVRIIPVLGHAVAVVFGVADIIFVGGTLVWTLSWGALSHHRVLVADHTITISTRLGPYRRRVPPLRVSSDDIVVRPTDAFGSWAVMVLPSPGSGVAHPVSLFIGSRLSGAEAQWLADRVRCALGSEAE